MRQLPSAIVEGVAFFFGKLAIAKWQASPDRGRLLFDTIESSQSMAEKICFRRLKSATVKAFLKFENCAVSP